MIVNNIPKFSIITPSYNMLDYLKLCHCSIMDQGVDVEHIVIDGGSYDGTVEWLKEQKDIVWISEKDRGMYDAINKGLKIANGEILACLNCDEQYLPGTLKKILKIFETNKHIDVIYGHTIIIDENGKCIVLKKAAKLYPFLVAVNNLYVYTASIFYRKNVFENVKLNDKNISVSDGEFIIDALLAGYKFLKINEYLSTFMLHGLNISWGTKALNEKYYLFNKYYSKYRYLYKFGKIFYYLNRLISRCYTEKKNTYSIYVEPKERTVFPFKNKFIF